MLIHLGGRDTRPITPWVSLTWCAPTHLSGECCRVPPSVGVSWSRATKCGSSEKERARTSCGSRHKTGSRPTSHTLACLLRGPASHGLEPPLLLICPPAAGAKTSGIWPSPAPVLQALRNGAWHGRGGAGSHCWGAGRRQVSTWLGRSLSWVHH